jgi:hypothetical protein
MSPSQTPLSPEGRSIRIYSPSHNSHNFFPIWLTGSGLSVRIRLMDHMVFSLVVMAIRLNCITSYCSGTYNGPRTIITYQPYIVTIGHIDYRRAEYDIWIEPDITSGSIL